MTSAQQNELWLQNVTAGQVAWSDMLGTFSVAVDKELSAAAAYRALGLDPRDAPKFGWLLKQPDRVRIGGDTKIVSTPHEKRRGGPGWLLALAAVLVPSAAAVYFLGRQAVKVEVREEQRAGPAEPARATGPLPLQEWEIRWHIDPETGLYVEDGRTRLK